MAKQIIKLPVKTRQTAGSVGTPKAINETWAFDVEDIVIPIRQRSIGGGAYESYFTARTIKGMDTDSRNNARIDYVVGKTLAQINALSEHFILLTVLQRDNVGNVKKKVFSPPEQMVFVRSRMMEAIRPFTTTAPDTGSFFYYVEDGNPLPVLYYVNENIDAIVAASSASFGCTDVAACTVIIGMQTDISTLQGNVSTLTSEVTALNAQVFPGSVSIDITGLNTIDLNGLVANTIVVLTSTNATESITSIINYSGLSKVTFRPAFGLNVTFNDGGGMKLDAPAKTCFGSNSGFLELTANGATMYQTNFIDQYN